MSNELDELFSRQPPYSEADLERVIAHFREDRARQAAGLKAKKYDGPKAEAVDLGALGLAKPKAITPIKLGGK